ncbi:MAG: nucleoside-diphosphate sugar epimerase/dehydratase [Ignavibacteriaceae bacterium]
MTNLYDEFRSRNVTFEIIALIKNVTVILISSIIILFLLKEGRLSRYFVVLFTLLNIILLGVEKIAFRKYLNFLRKRGRNLRSLLIVGAGEVGKNFYELIKHSSHFGYNIVGFVDDTIKPFLNGQYLGKIDELDNILNNNSRLF